MLTGLISEGTADPVAVLKVSGLHIERIGLEAGPLSQWLFEEIDICPLPATSMVWTFGAKCVRR